MTTVTPSQLDRAKRDLSWPMYKLYVWLWERRKAQWIKEAVSAYHREGFTHFTRVDGQSLWEAYCQYMPIRQWPTPSFAVRNAETESFKTIW